MIWIRSRDNIETASDVNYISEEIEAHLRVIDDLEEADQVDEESLSQAYDVLSQLYDRAGETANANQL